MTARAALAVLLLAGCGSRGGDPVDRSAVVAFAAALARADSAVADAVAREQIPGAVLVVSKDGRIVHERAYGYAQLYGYGMQRLAQPRAMTTGTLFDLASVTKVLATTMAVMLLVDRGTVRLDAPVYTYLPEFRGAHFDSITVRHLLTHSSGLHQWQPLYYSARNRDEALRAIRDLPLQWGVGEGRHYSDLGFMLLGYIVERVSGRRLDAFVHEELFAPLRLTGTAFMPAAASIVADRFAATSHGNPYERRMVHDTAFGYRYSGDPSAWNGWREYTLSGEVNDGNAWYAHGGVAGHAGLFSTGRDAAALMQLLLDRGAARGRRFMSAAVVDTFTAARWFGNGLGWMTPRNAPAGSFQHTGFTGTFVLGIPSQRMSIVLLTNKQNLGVTRQGSYVSITPLQNAIVEALLPR